MRLRATVTPTAGTLCHFGKARLTSLRQSTMRPLSGSSLIPLMARGGRISVLQQVGSSLGCTGRGADALRTAARDPNRKSALGNGALVKAKIGKLEMFTL